MGEGSRWRPLRRLWRSDAETEIRDELAFHLEMKARDLAASGAPAERAARAAEQAFGDRERIERELTEIGHRRERRERRASVLEDARTDLRDTLRSFLRRPGVPLLVVGMLSLGIGAGTAVFSLFDAVVLNPVAVERPAELLLVGEGAPGATSGSGFAYPMMNALRAADRNVESLAGYLVLSVGARAGEHAEQTLAATVTGNYFATLGVRPQEGRLLVAADEAAPGATPYVVVSDAFWRRALGADPHAIGRTILVNEAPLEVVGVAPPRFRGTDLAAPVDLWLPVTMVGHIGRGALWSSPDLLETWFFNMIEGVARVRPGSSADAALAELRAHYEAAAAVMPEQEFQLGERTPRTVVGMPFGEATAGRSRAELLRFLRLLVAVVATCLVIACVNVANLMMIRSTERAADMSVRAALGANPGRLFRQLLLESVVLGALAGGAGLLVALGAMRLLTPFSLPGGIALAELTLPLDLRVLAFTAGVALLCAVVFGLAPARAAARAGLMQELRRGAHARRGLWRGGSVLVSVQVALSVVLLVAAGLLIRSLQAALSVDLGYRTEGVAALSVGLEQHGYTQPTARDFVRTVLADVAARPGIDAAAAATRIPLDRQPLRFQIRPAEAPPERRTSLATASITPGYIGLLGVRPVAGRDFDWWDDDAAPRVALVTESAARTLWPDGSALGREIVVMFGAPYTVVGVLPDARFTRLGNAEAHVFLPLMQTLNLGGLGRMDLVARGGASGVALATLRNAVRAHDARLPTYRERGLHEQLLAVLMPQRFGAMLLSAFGAVALLISGIGIYAVATYDVARRRRELGIRAALGANPQALVAAVMTRSGAAILVGAALGLAGAAVATKGLDGIVFGISRLEPVSYAAAALVLGLVAAAASWLPARRAARLDPLSVIRESA